MWITRRNIFFFIPHTSVLHVAFEVPGSFGRELREASETASSGPC